MKNTFLFLTTPEAQNWQEWSISEQKKITLADRILWWHNAEHSWNDLGSVTTIMSLQQVGEVTAGLDPKFGNIRPGL